MHGQSRLHSSQGINGKGGRGEALSAGIEGLWLWTESKGQRLNMPSASGAPA